MNPNSKQQVVFIARTLWGGGVEKVLYELAHGMDRERFDVTVLYMLEDQNIFPYDPSVRLVCLQPAVVPKSSPLLASVVSPARRIFNFLRKIYHRIVPSSIRSASFVRPLVDHIVQSLVFRSAGQVVTPQYDIKTAIEEIWPQVLLLRNKLNDFEDDAVYIPLEELNTVCLWLAMSRHGHVLASHHVPYSWAQYFRFPDLHVRQANQWLYLNACRSADLVAFPSEGARFDLFEKFGIPLEKTIYLANPMNCKDIVKKSLEPLPVELTQLGRKTVFAQVSRLSLEKAPFLLIDACNILRKRYDDFVVLFVGGGALFNEMKDRVKENRLENHILLLGEQANPYSYMAASRATLLTSSTEGFGLVLVEAMLCGSVPVSTDCDGPRDIIDNNQYGLLVPSGDAQAFADAMYRIAIDDELYSSLKSKAHDRALRFDSSQVIKEWEDLILQIAAKH
jgi:glycosyltransferase involved in cell wall biosynthesis